MNKNKILLTLYKIFNLIGWICSLLVISYWILMCYLGCFTFSSIENSDAVATYDSRIRTNLSSNKIFQFVRLEYKFLLFIKTS